MRARELIPVGLGEVKASSDPRQNLVAFGLGSCVAVIAYAPRLRAGGMAHVVLPEGRAEDPQRGRFASSAVALLLHALAELGAVKEELEVKIAGGASLIPALNLVDIFNIGVRNVEAIRLALAHHGLRLVAEDTGGETYRTIELNVETGQVAVRRGEDVLIL